MDVKTAFLNGDHNEEVYMEQLDGFINSDFAEAVCRVLHALYSLKQANKMWYAKLDDFLVKKMGFEHVSGDPCFYSRQVDGQVMFILVNADDLYRYGRLAGLRRGT